MPHSVRQTLSAVACLAVALSCPRLCEAAETSGIRTALDDAGQYFTAPLRWDAEDWTYFGVTLAAVAAAHEFDSTVRTHFATGSNAVLNAKDKNSVRDALPAAALIAGTWATAGYLGDPDGYRETWRLLEAGVFSTVSGEVLTLAGGRERPDATTSPNQWRKGGDSFPSVHASAIDWARWLHPAARAINGARAAIRSPRSTRAPPLRSA